MIYLYSILGIVFITGWYFAVRYFLLKKALREIKSELTEIGRNPVQNRILRLPFPDRALGELLESVNHILEEARRDRLTWERREKGFQEQIENISHDLRTPLTVILGYLKILKRQWAAWKEAGETFQEIPFQGIWQETEEAADAMERNARILEKLTTQFYIYSQVSAGEYEMELEEVDACRVLRESLADYYQILERLSLKVELPEQPVVVKGNKDALERIFLNLLQNAGRYAGSCLDIHVQEKEDGLVCFLFENDGADLENEDIDHIFDRFYKGDSARKGAGSGLGLAIAKVLAERLGGSLTAEMIKEQFGESYRLSFVLTLSKTG